MAEWFSAHRSLIDGVGIDSLMGLSVWIVLACGRVALGNTAFAASSAFVTLELAARYHWPVAGAAAAGIASAGAAAYALGFALSRFGSAQFSIATLALGVLVSDDVVLPAGSQVRVSAVAFTPQIWLALAVTGVGLWFLLRSRTGRVFAAVAQDEPTARAVGIDPERARHAALVAGGIVAGVCGVLIVLLRGFLIAQSFGFDQNVGALAAVIIGGSASVAGPAVGAIALAAAMSAVPSLSSYRTIVQSAFLLVFSLALPGGLASIAARIARRSSTAGGS